ncbi:MAG: sodium/glucose cotransporter, partial [Flavobacterium sp.]
KGWLEGSAIESWFPNVPFLDQMGYTTLITMAVIILVSGQKEDSKGFTINKKTFQTSASFNVSAFAILLIVSLLYALFW